MNIVILSVACMLAFVSAQSIWPISRTVAIRPQQSAYIVDGQWRDYFLLQADVCTYGTGCIVDTNYGQIFANATLVITSSQAQSGYYDPSWSQRLTIDLRGALAGSNITDLYLDRAVQLTVTTESLIVTNTLTMINAAVVFYPQQGSGSLTYTSLHVGGKWNNMTTIVYQPTPYQLVNNTSFNKTYSKRLLGGSGNCKGGSGGSIFGLGRKRSVMEEEANSTGVYIPSIPNEYAVLTVNQTSMQLPKYPDSIQVPSRVQATNSEISGPNFQTVGCVYGDLLFYVPSFSCTPANSTVYNTNYTSWGTITTRGVNFN